MSIALVIDNVDRTRLMRVNSLNVDWDMKSRGTGSFELEGDVLTMPTVSVGSAIKVYNGGVLIWTGDIDEIEYVRVAVGRTHIFQRCRLIGLDRAIDKRVVGGDQTFGNPVMSFRSLASTVNTSGTAVSWTGLNQFTSDLAGQTITINGVGYTVASVTSPTALVLSSTAGVQTGVAASTTLMTGAIVRYLMSNWASGEGINTTKNRVGTVSTSGTAVSYVSGDRFGLDMAAQSIVINGVTYTVSSVTDTEHLILTGTAGTQTAQAYTASSSTYVAAGVTIPSTVFDYRSVGSAVKALAAYSGYMTWVDESGTLFFAPKTYIPSAYAITDSSNNFRTISLRRTREDVANTIHSSTNPAATEPQVEAYAGTGQALVFSVQFPIASMERMAVNGIGRSYGQYGIDTARDFYFNAGFTEIYQDADSTVLGPGDVLEVTYRQIAGNMVSISDSAAIAARAAVEGGTGIVEKFVNRSSVKSTVLATAATQAELDKRKNIVDQVVWTTDSQGLNIGQSVAIALTAPPIGGSFIIEKMSAKDEDGKQLVFTCTSGTGNGLDSPEQVLGTNDPSGGGPGGDGGPNGGGPDGGGPGGDGPGGDGGDPNGGGPDPEQKHAVDDHTPDKCTFGVGIGAPILVANDIAFHYPVFAPGGTAFMCKTTCVTAPASSSIILDIKKSSDSGATWVSIFPAGSLITVSPGFTGIQSKTDFDTTGGVFVDNDILRIDCTQTDAAAVGIVVALEWRIPQGAAGNTDFSETGNVQTGEWVPLV